MEVTFVREMDFFGADIFQEMVECQIGLNAEYANEQNKIISVLKSALRNYLNSAHLDLAIPVNGPYFHFVRNSFQDLVILLLESSDLRVLLNKLKEQRAVLRSKMADYNKIKANDSSQSVREKKAILKSIHDSVDLMTQMRIGSDRHTEKVIFKFQKSLDLAENTRDGTSGEDAFLDILRRGILSFYSPNLCEMVSQRLPPWRHQIWPHFKEQEEFFLKFVNDNMKLLDTSKSKLNARKWIRRKWRTSLMVLIKGNQCNRKEDPAPSTQ